MLNGNNIFLTGPPGSGKTYLLNLFIEQARKRKLNVAVTATTGIAATHLNGITIHSWAGIGLSDSLLVKDKLKLLNRSKLSDRYRSTDVLVIDEISMLDANRLDLINDLAKLLRGSNKAMGGMQVVLVGDLFQLPPVSKQLVSYVYLAKSWQELELKVCYLTEQHRQQAGDELNSILQAIRENRVTEQELAILRSKLNVSQKVRTNTLKLYSHNFDVDKVNIANLTSLKGKERRYKMQTRGSAKEVERLKKSILSPEVLGLKVGGEVIFTANDYKSGYVNGDRGKVVAFKSGYPVIRMQRQAYIILKQHNWRAEVDGMVLAEAWQLPLKLAWAITIHKSQGMSLDEAAIDLSHAFSVGMGYVALSRLRNIEGLYLLGLNKMSLFVDAKVQDFDKKLRIESDKQVLR